MKYFTDAIADQLQEEADASHVPIELLLGEMQLPQSTMDERITYEQYLFIKSVSHSALMYGLGELVNDEYEKEINLIDDTAEVTNSCVVDLLR